MDGLTQMQPAQPIMMPAPQQQQDGKAGMMPKLLGSLGSAALSAIPGVGPFLGAGLGAATSMMGSGASPSQAAGFTTTAANNMFGGSGGLFTNPFG